MLARSDVTGNEWARSGTRTGPPTSEMSFVSRQVAQKSPRLRVGTMSEPGRGPTRDSLCSSPSRRCFRRSLTISSRSWAAGPGLCACLRLSLPGAAGYASLLLGMVYASCTGTVVLAKPKQPPASGPSRWCPRYRLPSSESVGSWVQQRDEPEPRGRFAEGAEPVCRCEVRIRPAEGNRLAGSGALAGGRGFEPRRADPESAVLPLDDPPSTV